MYRTRKKRKLVIFSLLGVLLLMSVGYAAFQTSFQIKGSTQITSNWDVEITNISDPVLKGSAQSVSKMIGDDKLSASMEADLYEKGDSAEYIVTIENKGTIDAKLEDIVGNSSNSEAVLITFSGYTKGERLYKNGQEGSVKQIHVKIEYNPSYTGGEATGESNIQFTYNQAEGGTIEPKNTYLLTYDYKTNGGEDSEARDEYLDEGSNVDLTKKAIKKDWTFIGWNTNKDATEGLTNLTINNNTTLYAIYKKEVNATFDKNGSTSIGSTSLSCNMYNNQTSCIVKAPSITRDGYTVIGWNRDKNATTSGANVNANITLSSNATYYAITKNSSAYTASWNANGATLSSTEAKSCNTYNTATTCTVDAPTITRSGYEVIGFNTSAGATTNNSSYNTSTKKLTLSGSGTWYAVTKNNTVYTASWNANGATLSSTEAKSCNTYNAATTCQVDAPTITRNGYTIIGFNTSAGATTNNSSYNTSTKKLTISKNSTWYAVTKKDVTLTFVKGANTSEVGSTSGSCTIQNTATSCSVKAPTITPNTGYSAAGWSTTNGSTTGTAAGSNITVTANATYYGNSKVNSYEVIYKSGNLFYGLEDKELTTGSKMKYSISNKNITVTATQNDGYDFTPVRVYLEANKTYIFNCTSTGSWTGQTEAFLMLDGKYDLYYHMSSNNNHQFTPTTTGVYWLRLDVNTSGQTHTFSDISIYEKVKTESKNYGSALGTLPTVSYPGHTFDGWYTAASGGNKISTSTTVPANNVTYYAHWSIDSHTVTYNYSENGGTSATKTSASANYNSSIDLTPTATKSGYTFVGWNTNKDATTGLSSLTMGASNVTLYAIYSKTVTATFNKNGASTQTNASGTAVSDASVTRKCTMYNKATTCSITSPTIVAASGFTVVGYNTTAGATTSTWNHNTAKTDVGSNLTYYAVTKSSSTYTAKWNANGATLSSTSDSSCYRYNGGSSCTVDAPTITRNGFTITGFNTSSNSTTNNSNYNTSTKKLTISGNSTWYAITKKDVTLTFVKGANTASIGSTSGSCTIQNTATSCSVKTPSITSNDTYVPAGWSTTNGATTGVAAGSNITGITANTTYYGNSKADNVSLTLSTSSTTSTITITANAQATSGIKSYAYKIDGNNATCKSGTASNVCIIEGLTHNTTHTASATVTANSKKTATSSKSVSTAKINEPTYTETGTSTKTVTITYPSGCGSNYTCSYKKNSENWVTVTGNTNVTFSNSGILTGKISDGTNDVTSTYNVENEYYFDMNPSSGIASFDIESSRGEKLTNQTDYYKVNPNGTSFTITNIKPKTGYTYTGYTKSGSVTDLTGTSNSTIKVKLGDSNGAVALNSTVNTYSVSYTLNSGSVATANPTSYTVNTNTITLNNPTRSGYTFLGWTGSNDLSSGVSYTTSSPYTASARDHTFGNAFSVTAGTTYRVIVTAKRTAGTLSINGGIWYTEQSAGNAWDGVSGAFTAAESLSDGWIRYYKDVTVPTGKTKGKLYVQIDQASSGGTTTWSLADMHVIPISTTVTIPKGSTGNKSYTANWSIDSHTVTYNYSENGGTSATKTSASANYNSSIDLTPTATKSGYTFVGWNTNKDATTGLSSLTMGASNVTLYAIYSKTVTATFNKNGASTQTNASGTAVSDASVTRKCTMYNKATTCSITSPTIVAASGFTVVGYNTTAGATTSTWNHNTAKTDVGSNLTYYAVTKSSSTYTAKWNANGATLSSTSDSSCYRYNGGSSCTVDAPTITRNGYTIIGFNTSAGATTNNSSYNTSTKKLTISGSGTWYAVTKNNSAYTASWNANGATLSSTTAKSCNTYNTATTCTVDAPTITAPANTPTVLGFNTSANSNSNNSSYNTSTKKLTISGNGTWYAQTTKAKVTLTAKWNANNATLSSTANKTCDLAATFNGTAQATSCQVDAPTITAPANTPTVLGFNTAANSNSNNASYNTSTKKLTLTSALNNKTWYAQTTKAKVTLTASWNANGATLSSTTAKTCDLAATFNGTKQNTTCQVDAPTITRNGFTITGFNTSAGATTNNSSYNTSTKKLTISGNNTWYAITKKDVTLTFVKGANTASIGSTSGSCTIQNTATSCSVKTPTITSNDTYVPAGWSTTNGATTGVAAGSNITGLTSNATYYGNSKADTVSLTLSTSSTTNTITLTANAQATSGIKSYAYTLNGSSVTCKSGTASNICIIENKQQNTTYTAGVTVTANSKKTSSTTKSVTTKKLNVPTYTSNKNVITITYPTLTLDNGTVLNCSNGLTCKYKKDNGSEVTVKSTTSPTVTFDKKGTITATVAYETTTVSSTYTFAPTALNLSFTDTNTKLGCSDAQCALEKIKEMLD